MVQLTIQMSSPGDSCPVWHIIELQGDLETKSAAASLAGKFVGDLHFSNKGEPIMIIGHHILFGKVVKVEKPFAVLEKVRKQLDEDDMDTDTTDSMDYNVKAIVRQKLIFKTRPKPIIANVPKKI